MPRNLTTNTFGLLMGVALWATPSTASAHAGNNDPALLHVCIGNVSKVVRSVGVNGTCIVGPPLVAETAGHWSKEAIPGPKGDKGDRGDSGAPGVNGTNGLDGASVTFVDYFTGNQNGCPNGGAIYAVGSPPVQTHVCHGTNGADGTGGTRADGPCFDDANRYVDCGNGTVTDAVTGLVWLKQADCLAPTTWAAANRAAAGLKSGDCGLTDGSSPGDWRLPTLAEWEASRARAIALGCFLQGAGGPPLLTDDSGHECYNDGARSSFTGVPGEMTAWLSTSWDLWPNSAHAMSFSRDFALNTGAKWNVYSAWPVRGGSR